MMDLQGLDYNTRRKRIILPEYGREIQKMVDHALTIEDRAERQRCAESIIATMQIMVPQQGSKEDKQQKLWDHLAIMSDFKLDIDYPVDISQARRLSSKPNPLPIKRQEIPVHHYGAILFQIFEKLKTMPESPERNALVEQTANQMKLSLVQWSHGSADNEKVADDLARFTDGNIQLDLNTFRFARITPVKNSSEGGKKKRKK